MPVAALTEKQEAFAKKYVECGNASEAYRHAYNAENTKQEVVWVKASQVLSNGKVAVRVIQLQEHHAKRHDVTIDSLTAELDEAITIAKEEKLPSAIVSAVKEKGTLHGVRVEKTENKVTHEGALDLLNGD